MKKQLIALFAMIVMGSAYATDTATGPNKVYIEQVNGNYSAKNLFFFILRQSI